MQQLSNLNKYIILFSCLAMLLTMGIQAKGGGEHNEHHNAHRNNAHHNNNTHHNHNNFHRSAIHQERRAYDRGVWQGEVLETNPNGNVYIVPDNVPNTYQNTGGTWIYEPAHK